MAKKRKHRTAYQRACDAIRTEYNLDGDRLRAVCLKEVGIDVHDVYTQPREGKEVV